MNIPQIQEKRLKSIKIELNEDQKYYIVEQLLKGLSIDKICEELDVNSVSLWNFCKRDPQFGRQIQEAREWYCHSMTDDLLSIYDHCETMEDVQRARGQSDNIKWLAARRAPSVYGDSLNLSVKHTVDLTRVLEEANGNVSSYMAMKAINPSVSAEEVIEARNRLKEPAEVVSKQPESTQSTDLSTDPGKDRSK